MLKIASMPSVGPSAASIRRVLIAESDNRLAGHLREMLESESFEVTVCAEGGRMLELADSLPAELVVLDHALPEIGGVELCRRLRTFSDAYVIVLTPPASEADRIVSLSVGADDSVARPVDPAELLARIRAMQRRPRAIAGTATVHRHRELEVDSGARTVSLRGRRIALSRTEFDLLEALVVNARISLSRRQLLEQVWGDSWYGDDHVIDVHISNLRRKLGDRSYVETVRGFGYRIGGD